MPGAQAGGLGTAGADAMGGDDQSAVDRYTAFAQALAELQARHDLELQDLHGQYGVPMDANPLAASSGYYGGASGLSPASAYAGYGGPGGVGPGRDFYGTGMNPSGRSFYEKWPGLFGGGAAGGAAGAGAGGGQVAAAGVV